MSQKKKVTLKIFNIKNLYITVKICHYSFCCCLVTKFGEGNGTPLQYCCLENSMDGGAWWATVYGVAESRTQLSAKEGANLHAFSTPSVCNTIWHTTDNL